MSAQHADDSIAVVADRSADTSSTGSTRWLLLLLLACALAAYWNGFSTPFLFDDDRHIVQRQEIRDPMDWRWLLVGSRRPVLFLSLAANYQLGQLDVRGYHVFNFVVHVLAGWMLFFLARDSLRLCPGYAARRDAPWLAWAIAALWLVHPLQTQSVTYVVQRCESIMGLCFLLLLVCLLRGATSARPLAWYVAGVVAFWVGIASKEVMAAAVVVAPLYDRAFLADNWRQVWRKRWGFYTACAAPVLILVAVVIHQSATQDQMYGGFGQVGVRWWQYLASQGGVILHYLRLAVWPNALCLDYDWPVAKGWVAIGLPSAIVLVLLGGSLWLWRVAPRLGWVALAFFLILAPTSSFMPIIDLAVEHRMYLPLASLIALSVLLADRCLRHRWTNDQRRTWISAAILASLVLALIARTLLRNRDYRDPAIMWHSVVAQAPHNYKAYYNLGVALAGKRHTDAAIQAYQQALRLRPRYTDARYNLALQYDALGQLAQAQHHYLVLLRIDPHDAAARFNLAGIYHRQGCQREAIQHYRQALQDDPNHLRARGNLASLLAERGEYVQAQRELETAIRQAPDKAWLYDNYGNLFARQGRLEEAIQQYDRALQAQPNHAAAYLHKARALGRLGRRGDAIAVLHTVQQRFGPSKAASRLLAELQSESVVEGCEDNCPPSISDSAGGEP